MAFYVLEEGLFKLIFKIFLNKHLIILKSLPVFLILTYLQYPGFLYKFHEERIT